MARSERAFPNQSIHDAVADYIERGWRPIVIKERSKIPTSEAWQNSKPAPSNFGATSNVGIILGPQSNNLVDIDLDCPEACKIAALPALFGDLPAFGREDQLPGHRVLVCPGLPENEAKCKKLAVPKDEGGCILELRAGKGFTVFPPSAHEATVVWQNGNPPDHIPELEWERLELLITLTGLLSVALRHYPEEGSRDDFCMHLGGALMHMGVPGETGDELLYDLAILAGDEEAQQRRKCSQAWQRREEQNITGLTRLIDDYFGENYGKALRKWFGLSAAKHQGDIIPNEAIRVDTPHVSELFNQLQDEFISRAPELIFQRAGTLVHIRKLDEVETERDGGVVFQEETVEIAPIKKKWLELKADELGITFCRGGDKPKVCAPSNLDILIAAPEETGFPRLRGLSTTPTLFKDDPGYDPNSRLLLRFAADQFEAIPANPSKEQALEALSRLKHPLRKFPFRVENDCSVVLSAVLSGVVRGELKTCPLHGFSAPMAGTGKTKLAEFVAAIVSGTLPNMISHSAYEEEMEKRLFAIFLRGCSLINIDNVSEPLRGDTLCAMLTSPTFTGRILGFSEMATVDTRALMLATGNNLAVSGDLSRRTIICRLDAESEEPDRRHFDFDPVDDAKRYRHQLVSDALTVLRAFHAAGRPLPEGHMPLGSFEEWDNLVRCALIWLGEADPVETQERESDNEEREMQVEILEALQGEYAENWFTISDLHKVQYEDLNEFELPNRAKTIIASYLRGGQWDRRKAGHLLKRFVDKPVGQWVLRKRTNKTCNSNEYQVQTLG